MRYAWIERHRDDYAATRMCRLLLVSRTGYLQWRHRSPSTRAQANARLDAQVAAMHAASKGSYGRPRIVCALREQGLRVGHDRVRRSLQRQALRPVYRRPYRVTTDSSHVRPLAANVLQRRFDGWDINRAWVSDITYLSTNEGWLYLAMVMDLASRYLIGWSMRAAAHRSRVSSAANGLLAAQAGGWTDHAFRPRLSIRERSLPAVDRRLPDAAIDEPQGQLLGQRTIESFFKTLKVERIYQMRYETRAHARLDVVNWIEGFYNHRRLHSSVGYRTPAHVDSSLMAA